MTVLEAASYSSDESFAIITGTRLTKPSSQYDASSCVTLRCGGCAAMRCVASSVHKFTRVEQIRNPIRLVITKLHPS